MTDVLKTHRLSVATDAINNRIEGGISSSELNDLKRLATSGTIGLVDIRATLQELDSQNITPSQRAEIASALHAMQEVASRVAVAQADALTKTLAWIDTFNPFAYVRAALGGERVGLGQTW